MAAAEPSVDLDPVQGIKELMWNWGITGLKHISEETLLRTTDATIRNWGRALPMLRGIDAFQIQHVLNAAAGGHHLLPSPTGEQQRSREGR